jgi:hypothetical protein
MDTDIIWAAGLLDADGTITIKRALRGGKYNYIPFMQLAQIDTYKGRKNTEKLQETFGGNVNKSKYRISGKTIVIWQVTSKDACEVARKISKYSVGRSRQAKLLAEYADKFHGDDYVFHRLSQQEISERKKYFNTMRSYQEKGFAPTTTEREGTSKK